MNEDKDEARQRQRDIHEDARIAFISLGSVDADEALPAAQQLIGLISNESTCTSLLATIDEDAAKVIKAARNHGSADVRKANGKLIEWIDFRAMEIASKVVATEAAPDAGIDLFVSNRKMVSEMKQRFENNLSNIQTNILSALEEFRPSDWETDLFKELKLVSKRPSPEEFHLIRTISDFATINDPGRQPDSRGLSANELEKSIASAKETALLDIFRIVDVPKLRAAGQDQDESVRRPVQGLMTALALGAAPFFGVKPEQAVADPDAVLDALHSVKIVSEAEPGVPAINLRQAMIAKRNSFKPGSGG